MAKNIVFCADGTWNSADQDEDHDGRPDCTNVYKTFLALSGGLSTSSLLDAGEQEKVLQISGEVKQVAKYIHGVGDSKNPIVRILGGATGAGTIARIVRGYTYISRHYQPGDKIFIIGFSRGAYTARALAGLICSQGVLQNINYADKGGREEAYKRASQVWYSYSYAKSKGRRSVLDKLTSAVSFLPGFIVQKKAATSDLTPIESIAAVGVWDTVGALGIPEIFGDGDKHDAFQFSDLDLNPKIEKGWHAVALDEQRAPFIPTLWNDSECVEQVLFPGAHSDVGGGYPESGLSNISLDWMTKRLKGSGVLFDKLSLQLNHADTAHEPWETFIYADKRKLRNFGAQPQRKLKEDASIARRSAEAAVKPDPKKPPTKYAPPNRPLRAK
jgi:uncharacterized protein (DUF2235 family)